MFNRANTVLKLKDDSDYVQSMDIGENGGFYVRNYSGENVFVSTYTAMEKSEGIHTDRVDASSKRPRAVEFGNKSAKSKRIKEKYLRQLFYDKFSKDFASIDFTTTKV